MHYKILNMYKINQKEIEATSEFKENLTFNKLPVTLTYSNNEVYINCKTITGTLTEMETFFNARGNHLCYFGGAKVRLWNKNSVRIDCLEDNILRVKIILLKAKKLKDDSNGPSIVRKTEKK